MNMLYTNRAKALANIFSYNIAKGYFVDESPEGTNSWTRGLNFYDLQTLRRALFAASTVDRPDFYFYEMPFVNSKGERDLLPCCMYKSPASRWDRVAAFRRVCNGND
jgi:hypothetical protein